MRYALEDAFLHAPLYVSPRLTPKEVGAVLDYSDEVEQNGLSATAQLAGLLDCCVASTNLLNHGPEKFVKMLGYGSMPASRLNATVCCFAALNSQRKRFARTSTNPSMETLSSYQSFGPLQVFSLILFSAL